MRRVSAVLWSALLAVTFSDLVVANAHHDVAQLGEKTASRVDDQFQTQSEFLLLVGEFKSELQQLFEQAIELSGQVQKEESFVSRFFTRKTIDSELEDKITLLKRYQQQFSAVATLPEANKSAIVASIDRLLWRLQQTLNAVDSEAKVQGLKSLSEEVRQSQQREANSKQLTLPATTYTLKVQEIASGRMPGVGAAPYSVNPQAGTSIRRKDDLTSFNLGVQGIPVRPGRAACYQEGQVDLQDLAVTPEVPLTDAIKELASSLDYSPLKLFNYVANQLDYELYQGSVKGALGALSSSAGNDTDHASLLIALLRASGYPARYVRGSIEFDPARNEHLYWAKIKDPQQAAPILRNAGKKVSVEKAKDGGVSTLQVDHVWVEACIPYAHYRGSRQDESGYQWLSLDASYKHHALRVGIQHNETFDYARFLKQRSEALVHELYEEQIEKAIKAKHPNATIADVGDRWIRQQFHHTHIPESLPFRVINYAKWSDVYPSSTIAVLPESHRKQMLIEINGTQKTTLNLLDSTQQRVTLSFVGVSAQDQKDYRRWQQGKSTLACPATLLLKPLIKLDGVVAFSQNPITVPLCEGGTFSKLEVKISVNLGESEAERREITFEGISPLNYYALQVYGFQSSDQYLEQRIARLLAAINDTAHPWNRSDSVIGEYLDVLLLKYMRYINDGMIHLGDLDGKTILGGHHIGLIGTQAKVEYLFDTPLAVNATNMLIDVPGATFVSAGTSEAGTLDQTFKLAGVLASQYESYIWQESADRDAISTISGLQIAHQQKIPVKTFTVAAELKDWLTRCAAVQRPQPCYPGAVIDGLAERLQAEGGELTLPQRPFDYDGWDGLVSMHITGKYGSLMIGLYNGGYATNTRINSVETKSDLLGNYLSSLDLTRKMETIKLLPGASIKLQHERLKRLAWQRDFYKKQQAQTQTHSAVINPARPIFTAPETASKSASFKAVIAQHSINSVITKGASPGQTDGDQSVNLITGNMYHTETDFRYPARGLPLMFTRAYNSLGLEDGPLGYGWTHNYHHRLKFVDGANADNKTSEIIWVDGTGAERIIRLFSDDISVAGVGRLADKNIMTPPGLYFKLQQTANGYEITEKSGLVYRFGKVSGKVGDTARLLAISDPRGNTLRLTYNGNQLTKVTDPDQRAIRFSYNHAKLLTHISDWAGNHFQYEYDAKRNLIAVKTPDNTDQATTTYRYYSTSDGPTLDHRMQTFRYANGYQMTFEYYPSGKVFRHYNASNDTLTFKYNIFRRETQTQNERGDIERFFFNKKGSLVKKIDLKGGKHLYAFEHGFDPFLRTRYTNPLGHTTDYEYDISGDLIKTTLASGDSIIYSGYNRYGQPALIKNAQGDLSLMLYSPQGQLQEQVQFKQGKTNAFAPELTTTATLAAQAEDIIAWTRYHYNAFGNLIKKQAVKNFADPESGPYIEYSYQDSYHKVDGIYPVSVTYRGDLDGDGLIADQEGYGPYAFEYDELGHNIKGYDAEKYPFTRHYSPGGRLLSSKDHRGIKTHYQYDPSGLVLGTNQSSFIQGDYQLHTAVTFKYDPANRLIVQADQSGAIIHYQHDPIGNVIQVTDADGYTSQRKYDPAHQLTTLTAADGRETHYQYDPLGRKIAVIYPGGNTRRYRYHGAEHNGWLHQVVHLDTLGLPTRFQAYQYNKNGQVIKLSDHLGRSTLTDYDSLGRALRIVSPAYDDSVLGRVRPVTLYRYNSLGFLIEIHAGHTNAAGDVAADQVTLQVTYTYDDFGRKLTETNALKHTWRWTYNEHDQVLSFTEPEGQVIRNDYDASGFLSQQHAEHNDQTLTQSYRRNPLGFVTESENAVAHYRYHYDQGHRLAHIEELKTGKSLSYDYSLGGLLNGVTDPEGMEVYYQYDPAGRLIGLQTGLKHFSFDYDAAGRLASKELPNHTNVRYDYYPDDSLKSQQILGPLGFIEQHLYQYDAAGRVSRHLHTQQGFLVQRKTLQDRRYQYDNLDQLTQVYDGERIYDQIDYDPFGNWRQRTQTQKPAVASGLGKSTTTYPTTTVLYQHNVLHQLTRIHTADTAGEFGDIVGEYDYNNNGHMIRRKNEAGELSFTYNALGQLIKAQGTVLGAEPGASAQELIETYQYGPEGNRLQKTTNGQAIYYRYDRGNLWAEYQDPSASAEAFYVQGTGIDQPLARIGKTGPQYYHSDQLGSITAVTDRLGFASATQRYSAWGEVQEANPSNGIPTYGYAGREPDATGLIYYRNRYYDPSIGRFTQQDALGFIDGVNRYTYVMNNPVNYIDPWGPMATRPSRSVGALDRTIAGVTGVLSGVEAGNGVAACSTLTGCALGGPLVAHGADNAYADLRTAITGKQTESLTTQGLRAVGVPNPELANGAIGVVMGAGGVKFLTDVAGECCVPR